METREIIKVLEENLLPFTEENVRAVIDVYPPGANDLVEEVLEEGVRRSMRALDALWEALGSSPDASVRETAEEFLRYEKGVELLCLPKHLLSPDLDEDYEEDEEYIEDDEGCSEEGENERGFAREGRVEKGIGESLGGELPDKKNPPEGRLEEEMVMEVRFMREFGNLTLESAYAQLPASGPFRTLVAKVKPGLAEISVGSSLYAVNDRVFFEGKNLEDVQKALKGVEALRPYFSSVGLADLGGAFLALQGLEEGEAKVEGPYLLARSGRWFLRRGLILGDPELDRDLLSGKPVTVSFPGGVEFLLRALLEGDRLEPWKLRLLEVGIHFKGEDVSFGPHFSPVDVFRDDPVFEAIQAGLQRGLKSLEIGLRSPFQASLNACSPKTLAFLKAFVRSGDPLRDLTEGRLQAHATAELFAEL
jgi:hypothetical protein